MNAKDVNTESDGDAPSENHVERSPQDALRSAVESVLALLAEAQAEAEKTSPGAAPRLLTAYRARFRVVMGAFADALADVLARAPASLANSSPDNPLAPIIERARDLPLFRRAQQSLANDEDDRDLQRLLLAGRGAGFDLPSLLLEDYFQDTVIAQTFRSRVPLLGTMLRAEVRRRLAEGSKEVRVLNLRCSGLLELNLLLEDANCAAHTSLTCVDDSALALRLARQNIEHRLGPRPTFVRADPLTIGAKRNWPQQPFDLVITFSLFDMLPAPKALSFARDCRAMLAPGGALITSGYLPDVPRGDRALSLGLLGAQVNFWDEDGWRNLLGQAAYDHESARFERHPPAALAILAQRA